MLLNLDLLRRPSNWFVVLTMVIFALFALHYSLALIHGPLSSVAQKHPSKITNQP